MSDNRDDYVFFWKIDQQNGYMSQWYKSPFKARIQMNGIADTGEELILFPTAEHFMMACKALLFGDHDVFRQVIATPARTQSDMKKVKSLGRKVKNFQEEAWNKNRDEIVLEGNLHKFRQNADLRRLLMETGEKTIAEASPLDRTWGIGFGAKRAPEVKDRWGLNLLGIALMKTREILREENASKARV